MENHQTPPPATSTGVIEKCMLLLDELARGPLSVQSAAKITGVPRATTHRLIKSLEEHRIVVRDLLGRYAVGPRLGQLASAREMDPLDMAVTQILDSLADWSGLEAFLFWASGAQRICIAATGIATSDTHIGRRFEPSDSATSQVLLAWSASNRIAARGLYQTTAADLTKVRKRGWAYSINAAGWAGTSAPVRDMKGDVIGAVTVYGPSHPREISLTDSYGLGVKSAGERLTQALIELSDAVPERDTVPLEWYI